jgi:GT2 family glycosyltransferase
VKEIKKAFPSLHLIESKTNRGFAGGNNLGITAARKNDATHILVINPDVTVGKVFFKPLLTDFRGKIGITAPAISHYQNGRLFYGLEGYLDWRLGQAKHINLEKKPPPKLRPAEFVTFACVMIRAEVFQKIGLLDENYFMYLEDVDYCLRTKKAGYEIVLDPSIVVDHSTSSSFKRATDKLPISFVSQIRFINKWLPFPRNVIPLIYAFFFYPYLYLLWTYFDIKKKLFR